MLTQDQILKIHQNAFSRIPGMIQLGWNDLLTVSASNGIITVTCRRSGYKVFLRLSGEEVQVKHAQTDTSKELKRFLNWIKSWWNGEHTQSIEDYKANLKRWAKEDQQRKQSVNVHVYL